jgi:hypothetical protein
VRGGEAFRLEIELICFGLFALRAQEEGERANHVYVAGRYLQSLAIQVFSVLKFLAMLHKECGVVEERLSVMRVCCQCRFEAHFGLIMLPLKLCEDSKIVLYHGAGSVEF